jgi:hypothetical protein
MEKENKTHTNKLLAGVACLAAAGIGAWILHKKIRDQYTFIKEMNFDISPISEEAFRIQLDCTPTCRDKLNEAHKYLKNGAYLSVEHAMFFAFAALETFLRTLVMHFNLTQPTARHNGIMPMCKTLRSRNHISRNTYENIKLLTPYRNDIAHSNNYAKELAPVHLKQIEAFIHSHEHLLNSPI